MEGTFERIPTEIMRRKDLSSSAKLVYGFMRALIEKGRPVGQRLVARECGMSKTAAQRATQELVDGGLLTRATSRSGSRARYSLPENRSNGGPLTGPTVDRSQEGEAVHHWTGSGPTVDRSERTNGGPVQRGTGPMVDRSPVQRWTGSGPMVDHDQTPYVPDEEITSSSLPVVAPRARVGDAAEESAGGPRRRPPDLSTGHGRHAAFERAYLERLGGMGLGVASPRVFERFKKTIDMAPAPDDFRRELTSWLDIVEANQAEGRERPRQPGNFFLSKFGSWAVELQDRDRASRASAARDRREAAQDGRLRPERSVWSPPPVLDGPTYEPTEEDLREAERVMAELGYETGGTDV